MTAPQLQPGQVLSYTEMCATEGANLQRGMNFHLSPDHSVILMSVRQGAPYADEISSDGRLLIYEGHDLPKSVETPNPKQVDQPLRTDSGRLTQNGLFFEAAMRFKRGDGAAEHVRVYEKLRAGIWVFNGTFLLVDAWGEERDGRTVFRFKLELLEGEAAPSATRDVEHHRLIPSSVKVEVWARDKGNCVLCGRSDNLHFDHIIPFSKGGSSLVASNVQLLCARHNLAKHDRIE